MIERWPLELKVNEFVKIPMDDDDYIEIRRTKLKQIKIRIFDGFVSIMPEASNSFTLDLKHFDERE